VAILMAMMIVVSIIVVRKWHCFLGGGDHDVTVGGNIRDGGSMTSISMLVMQ